VQQDRTQTVRYRVSRGGGKRGEWDIVAIMGSATVKNGIYVQMRDRLFAEGYVGINLRDGVRYPELRMENQHT